LRRQGEHNQAQKTKLMILWKQLCSRRPLHAVSCTGRTFKHMVAPSSEYKYSALLTL